MRLVSDEVIQSRAPVIGAPPAVTFTDRGTVSPTLTTAGPVYVMETSPMLSARKRSARTQPPMARLMPMTGIVCRNRMGPPPSGPQVVILQSVMQGRALRGRCSGQESNLQGVAPEGF